MVEPPEADNVNSLPQERVDDITNMLATIVRTSLDKDENPELTEEAIQQKIAVSVQPFAGKMTFDEQVAETIPSWIYLIGGVMLAVIIVLILLFVRAKRKQDEEIDEEIEEYRPPIEVPDVNETTETEESLRRKQLEKMAKESPEEFAKLLRSWIAED